MPHLVVLKGRNQGQQYVLERPKTVLGREQDCDVLLEAGEGAGGRKQADVVSRKHAVILCEHGKYYIEDGDGSGRASRNGTFVNAERVPFPGRVLLKNNDVIKICDFALAFREGAANVPLPEEAEEPSSFDASVSHDSSSVFLAQSADKLKLLLDITNHLSNTLELNTLLPEVVESLLQLFKQADHGFLILVDETTRELVPQIVKSRRPDEESHIGFSASIVKQCIKTVQGILSKDAEKQFSTSDSVAGLELRSVMCAPLWTQDHKAFGVLLLDSRDPRKRFTEEDINLLMGVASQASIALTNARFHRDALARERLKRDLALARAVQRSFLPASLPEIPGYEFYACNESALEVGGDYYDFIPLPRGRLGVVLGDVAGKGVAAALVMARFSAEARAVLRGEAELAPAIHQLNALMQSLSVTDRFMTFAALVLDPTTHTLTIVNAGHPPPLRVRGASAVDEAIARSAIGPPLGIQKDYAYETQQLAMQPGDRLVLFSDGVTESMNAQGEQLGAKGLRKVLQASAAAPRELGERILHAIEEHVGGSNQHDDITLVCLGRMK